METIDNELYSALIDIIRQESSPEAVEARNLMLKRIAMAGDITPSRIPAPLNITEIGGYINLLESIKQENLRNRMLASVLGVAMPDDLNELISLKPVLFFVRHISDRPDCEQVNTLPLAFYMRNDFLESFISILEPLHKVGAMLPIYQTTAPRLPALTAKEPSGEEILRLLGRILELAPTAAFINPEQDPIIVADIEGETVVYAKASGLSEEVSVNAYIREGDEYRLEEITAKLIPIEVFMRAAGWYMKKRTDDDLSKPYDPATALIWRNETGLVPGRSSLSGEMSLLYSSTQIVESCVRDLLFTCWNGEEFA